MSQRHRHEYAADLPRGLPGSIGKPPRSSPPFTGSGAHRAPAQIRQVRAGVNLKDVKRRFLAYSSPPRSPDPRHLAVLTRPGFVRAAPALPGTTRIRLPSAPPTCCDRPAAKVSHLHSNQQRLTAQTERFTFPVRPRPRRRPVELHATVSQNSVKTRGGYERCCANRDLGIFGGRRPSQNCHNCSFMRFRIVHSQRSKTSSV